MYQLVKVYPTNEMLTNHRACHIQTRNIITSLPKMAKYILHCIIFFPRIQFLQQQHFVVEQCVIFLK